MIDNRNLGVNEHLSMRIQINHLQIKNHLESRSFQISPNINGGENINGVSSS